ncbi:hypothetical protein SLS59_007157 [Nothophoma quercina]|uniref:Uncharacterized protein n=1 Tax=Nothophoma quercina TaxID=749835 RepID=A0ABR3R180_9PLEO
MARLSAEHFRSNVAMSTPISTRTSGRFRDIFKPHRSTSSVSPKTLTKSPPVAFEAVDSPSSDGDYFQAVAQPSVRKVDDEVETSAKTEGSMSESNQAAFGAFGAFGGVQASGGVMLDQIIFDSEPDRKFEVEGAGALSSSTPVQDDVVPQRNDRDRQKSYASNIFDDKDCLSAGIREYVESKIAEAFHKHSCDCPVRAPLHIMATFEVNNSDIVSQGPSLKRIPTNLPLLHDCKPIGPVVLKDSTTTSSAQLGIIYVYAFFVIFKALAGPGPLFIVLWRMCIALAS